MGLKSAPRYINKLSNKIHRGFDETPVIKDISPAEGRVLYYLLDKNEPVFQKDIEEEFSVRPSSATNILKKMENDDLIKRVPVETDGRLKRIIVTDRGLSYKAQVNEKLRAMEHAIVKDISDEDMEVFYRVVEQMLKNMP